MPVESSTNPLSHMHKNACMLLSLSLSPSPCVCGGRKVLLTHYSLEHHHWYSFRFGKESIYLIYIHLLFVIEKLSWRTLINFSHHLIGKKFENTEMFGQYPLQVNGFKDLHECLEAAMIEGEIESLHSDNSGKSGQEVSAPCLSSSSFLFSFPWPNASIRFWSHSWEWRTEYSKMYLHLIIVI